jgi:hypothetical protein
MFKFLRTLVILICLIVLSSCSIGNSDYKYIYENKCNLTGKTKTTEYVDYLYYSDPYGGITPSPFINSQTEYEYKCSDNSLQWSQIKYDITQFYNKNS